MAVTLADVARKAGVSAQSVSNAVNGTGRMSERTRERILAVAGEMGYHTNRPAQMLRAGATRTIGLAIPNFGQPFFAYYCDLLINAADKQGYGVVIATYVRHANGLADMIEETYRLNADGWIFFTDKPLNDSKAATLLHQQYPVVLTGDYSAHGLADDIIMANVDAAHDVTDWLLSGNNPAHEVAFIGAPPAIHELAQQTDGDLDALEPATAQLEGGAAQRLSGYLRSMRKHGMSVPASRLAPCRWLSSSEGFDATQRLLNEHRNAGTPLPDSLFCANDAIAIGAMETVRQAGLHIPDDVEIIGFDNTSESQFVTPHLTTLDPSVQEYAQLAVDRVIARINGDDSPAATYTTTQYRIVERQTTRPR